MEEYAPDSLAVNYNVQFNRENGNLVGEDECGVYACSV